MLSCTIAASDYRELNLDEKSYRLLKSNLKRIIKIFHTNGVTDFYTDCDYGIPLLCAGMICRMKKFVYMKLHIIIPLSEFRAKAKEGNRFMKIFEEADHIRFIKEPFGGSEEAYMQMIDSSAYVIIFGEIYDNKFVSEYAVKKGLTPVYINMDKLLSKKRM